MRARSVTGASIANRSCIALNRTAPLLGSEAVEDLPVLGAYSLADRSNLLASLSLSGVVGRVAAGRALGRGGALQFIHSCLQRLVQRR